MKNANPLSFLTDVVLAFVLLTRLPMPRLQQEAFDQSARAVWAYPVVGAALGALALGAAFFAQAMGLPDAIAAGFALAVLMMCTGAMHEDGLADTVDGFWGGHSIEHRLNIMKDSQIGSYGTLALVLTVGLRWIALTSLLTIAPLALIGIAALSRAAMPVVMLLMEPARPGGLAQSVGRPGAASVLFGLALALLFAGYALGTTAFGAALVVLVSTCLVLLLARRKIGGQTGDVLGATQQLSELAALIFCVAALT